MAKRKFIINAEKNRSIVLWGDSLGLFPLNLFQNSKTEYILLNGNTNSFCIDIENNHTAEDYFNYSWSADVESFITYEKESINLFKWNKHGYYPEKFDKKIVLQDLERFYKYIGSNKPKKENSVVTYVMNLYGKLRNYIREEEGTKSLKAFLYLLAFSYEKKDVDLEKWGLDTIGKNVLNGSNMDEFISNLLIGMPTLNLKPDISLLLRHTTGKLFEEAHYTAFINNQINIWETPEPSYERNNKLSTGVFFTPSYITRVIVEECLKSFDISNYSLLTILDPACGSGEFLKEAYRQLRGNGYKGKIVLVGLDISESAIDMANFTLHFEKLQWKDANVKIELKIVEDSLTENWNYEIDILLMNPPYLSWELMSNSDREITKSVLGNLYQKNPNMASAFLWKAVNSLTENSVLGCIVPSSIFNADSYDNLREEIHMKMNNKLIGKLGNYIFYGALVDATIYIAKKPKTNSEETIFIWANNIDKASSDAVRFLRKFHKNETQPITDDNFSIYKSSDKIWSPISYKSNLLKNEFEKSIVKGVLSKIDNLFDVKQGVRTGFNKVFIVDQNFYESLNLKQKKFFRPVINNNSIRNGRLFKKEYLWYPYGKNLKIDAETLLKENIKPYYDFYLKPNKEKLQERSEVKKGLYKWWELTRERTWQFEKKSKLISTEFGKSGSFAYDLSGDFIVERGNAWLLKEELNEEFHYAYLAIFNCKFFDELLAMYSKQIAGGNWWYLGNKFVKGIPLPDLKIAEFEIFNYLVEYGKKFVDGEEFNSRILYEGVKQLYTSN